MTVFDMIKRYYLLKAYEDIHIAAFVVAGALTPEQYKSITGEDYNA